jgi:pyruvate dehydrogenase E2 component (dihydrolipoamide acetyltransferase)
MPVDVLVPPVGTTVDLLTLVKWYRQEGDTVQKDEPLFSVETDKATLDIESPASGVLHGVSAQEGDEVVALSRIALILGEGESAIHDAPQATSRAASRVASTPVQTPSVVVVPKGDRIFISPRAKRTAEAQNFAWQTLQGTGPEGAIIERDVLAAIAALPAQPPLPVEIPTATISAPVMLNAEVDVTDFVALRTLLQAQSPSVSDDALFVFALAHALREHPRLNASLENGVVQVWNQIHIGLVVAGAGGLLLPLLKEAETKRLAALGEEIRTLTESPQNSEGATFALTNLGRYGIDSFTPLLPSLTCPCLGVARIKSEPTVIGDQILIRKKMWVGLTFDHRLVDGITAALFLQRVTQLLERPQLLLT